MRAKLWYKGFTVEITGDPDVTMKAFGIVLKLIAQFAEQLKSGRG